MKCLKLYAHGKINLSLDVLGKRSDGYHELRMIMQQIDLKDIVALEEIAENMIIIESESSEIPLDENNIVYKIAYTLKQKFKIDSGVKIKIEKHIPVSAGLAGGSTDAAATAKGLNELWSLGLSDGELSALVKPIGADIPYCLLGGTALAEGIGDRLKRLKPFKDRHILLANSGIEVSTASVYQNLDLSAVDKRPDTESLIAAIESGDTDYVAHNMVNLLESVTIARHPEIAELKQEMLENGAIGAMMSGSGPTVFGIFSSEEALDKCKAKLEGRIKHLIKTKTI